MPAAIDPIEIDQGKPAGAGDLEVVAGYRPTPPALLDAPVVTNLDSFEPTIPVESGRLAGRTEFDIDGRVLSQ
jgi:hypothetical protein